MSELPTVTTPNAKIKFVPLSTRVAVRPGQCVEITIGGTTVTVEGVDHQPCRDLSAGPHKADIVVILHAGETYSTIRDDGTVLKVRAE